MRLWPWLGTQMPSGSGCSINAIGTSRRAGRPERDEASENECGEGIFFHQSTDLYEMGGERSFAENSTMLRFLRALGCVQARQIDGSIAELPVFSPVYRMPKTLQHSPGFDPA